MGTSQDIGIFAEFGDGVQSFRGVDGSLHSCFLKELGTVSIGEVTLKDVGPHFGVIDPRGDINGLLGLDLLMRLGTVIDIKRLSLTFDAM